MPRARALVEWSFAVDFTNCPRWFSEADFPHLCEAFCPKFLPPSVIQGILLVNLAKLSVNYSIATTYYCNWMLKIHVLHVLGSTCHVLSQLGVNKIHVSTRCLTVMLPDSCQIIRLRCFISSKVSHYTKTCDIPLQMMINYVCKQNVQFWTPWNEV